MKRLLFLACLSCAAAPQVTTPTQSNAVIRPANGPSGGGSGNVSGPGSSTDNALVRWDGTAGDTIQNSPVTCADTTGELTWVGDALIRSAAGDTNVMLRYEGTGKTYFSNGVNAQAWVDNAGSFFQAGTNGYELFGVVGPDGTQPSFIPDRANPTTGFGLKATNKPAIIVGGASKLVADATTIDIQSGVDLTMAGTASTGTGGMVRATSPTLTTPALGTPSALTLTNATGLPIGGITGLGTGVGTAMAAAVTGSGGIVLAAAPSTTDQTITASAVGVTPLTVNRFSASQTAPLIKVSEQAGLPILATGTGAGNAAIVWEAGNILAFTNANYSATIEIRVKSINSTTSGVFEAGYFVANNAVVASSITGPAGTAIFNSTSPSAYRALHTSHAVLYGTVNTTADTGLTRGAAGRVQATDGSSGYGTMDASDYLVSGVASTGTGGVVRATTIGSSTTAGVGCYKQTGADVTNATTTLANLSDLTCTLAAGASLAGKIVLYVSDSLAADGALFDFDGGTATMTNFRAHCTLFDSALNLSTQKSAIATDISAATVTGDAMLECHLSMVVNAAGTFIPRQAQVAHTTGTLTTYRGSNLMLTATP
jgi:hypothetical protein